MLTKTTPQAAAPTNTPTDEVQADVQADVQAEPWHWFTSTRDCGSIVDHEAHPWGPLAEREWCKGEPVLLAP